MHSILIQTYETKKKKSSREGGKPKSLLKKAQVTKTKFNSTNMVIHKRKQLPVLNRCNHHAIFQYAAEATLTTAD